MRTGFLFGRQIVTDPNTRAIRFFNLRWPKKWQGKSNNHAAKEKDSRKKVRTSRQKGKDSRQKKKLHGKKEKPHG